MELKFLLTLILLLARLVKGGTLEESTEPKGYRTLKVGEEKMGEMLPLKTMESVIYQVQGLDPSNTYEIKISYPAFVPAAFTLTLLEHKHLSNRRLLNTEKIIFPAGKHMSEHKEIFVLLTVKPIGVVAKKNFKEQEFVIYNILCERVYFGGIPEQAWWVGFLGIMAILSSFLFARHLLQALPPLKTSLKGS